MVKKIKYLVLKIIFRMLNLFPYKSFRDRKLKLGAILIVAGAFSVSCSGEEKKHDGDGVEKKANQRDVKVTCYEMPMDTNKNDTL